MPVAPLLQVSVPVQPVAVKVALEPLHKLLLLATTVGGVGGLPVVIVTMFDTGPGPQIFSQTTLYVPATVTTMLLPVAPLLHFKVPLPLQPLAVKVTVWLPQIVPLVGVIEGVGGVGNVLITTGVDATPSPHSFTHFAV